MGSGLAIGRKNYKDTVMRPRTEETSTIGLGPDKHRGPKMCHTSTEVNFRSILPNWCPVWDP